MNKDKLFHKDGQVISYSPLQIQQGYDKGLKELTDNEVEEFINPPKTAEQITMEKIIEYKQYLTNTDHKFLNGYKSKEGEDLDALEIERDYKREFIRLNEGA